LVFSLPAAQHLAAITSRSSYPNGAILFAEGQSPHGLFIVCKGRVQVSMSWTDDKTPISRISDAGEVLGLAEALSGNPYYTTAEALEPMQANFIGRADFLNFLREHSEASLRVAEQLSEDYRSLVSVIARVCDAGHTKL
jgi:CRP/FNR family cyclic AMP-dependent transcriptional regulator